MNFIQDNLTVNKRNSTSNKDKHSRTQNEALRRPVLGASAAQPFSRQNQPSTSTSVTKPAQGSAAMKSCSSRVTDNSHVVVALCEGRGKARGIVGIAAMDINRPVLVLCQISDTQTYTNTLTKLNIFRPVEVLIPAGFVECPPPSRIFTLLKDQFPNISVSTVSRSAFRSTRGMSYITSLCAPEFQSVIFFIREKFYALASASALIKYIQKEQHIMYPTRTIKVEYQEPEDTAVIDIDSADRLELVTSCNNEERSITLLSMLDHCVTDVGSKMLRATILQPPCIQKVTQERLDCVQELLQNTELRIKLKGVLANLHNIECALLFGAMVPQSSAGVSEKQLNYTLHLKTLLMNIEPLRTVLQNAHHPLFRSIHDRLVQAPYSWLLKKINKVLNDDAHPATGHAGDLQRCFAIRSGLNGFLDVARRTYIEVIDDMRAYVQNVGYKYGLAFRLQHNVKRGFHIILNMSAGLRNVDKSVFSPHFVKVEKNSTHFSMTTPEMTNMSVRARTTCQEIESISNVIIYQLMATIRQCIGHLYRLCDDVALLDVIQSLATVSSTTGYVRPEFSTKYMQIKGARHPLLEHASVQEPVPNDINASDMYNLHIVTGPNMSGKSIYVRQMPLLQVLAQIGCYVPAQSATFRSCTHIFARISVEDYLHDNSSSTTSTFVREMTEVQYMLNTLHTDSFALVVLDELCHSTSVDEGVSIAIAVCEQLLKTKSYIFVATHFLSMTKLASMYYSVSNSHLEAVEAVRDDRKCLKFTHRLLAGLNGVQTYGIMLSRICGGSDLVSDRAEEILHDLLPTYKTIQAGPQNITYLKYRLYADLKLLQLQNKLTAEVERQRLDEYEKVTGEHYEIGQVLSVDKVPSRTSSSRGSRTAKTSTATASETEESKASVYDQAREKCQPGAFDKPIEIKWPDTKIYDLLIPMEADFLHCITSDSPDLDQLGVTVRPCEIPTNSSPSYSPTFDLNIETYCPSPEPKSNAGVAKKPVNSPAISGTKSSTSSVASPSFEPQSLDSETCEQASNFDPFDCKSPEVIDLTTSPPKQSSPVNPFLREHVSCRQSHDNVRPSTLQVTGEEIEYRSATRYASTSSDRHESLTVANYYAVSNYCVTDCDTLERHRIQQEITVQEKTYSYLELPSRFLGSCNTGSSAQRSPWYSSARTEDSDQIFNVHPSTSGYQTYLPATRTSAEHLGSDDFAYPSTSGFQSRQQIMPGSRSAESSVCKGPTSQSNIYLDQQTTGKVEHQTNYDDMAYPSTSRSYTKPECNDEEDRTDNPFLAKFPPRKSVTFGSSNSSDFKLQPRIQPSDKPVDYLTFLNDQEEKRMEVNKNPSRYTDKENILEPMPSTSRAETTKPGASTETAVSKRANKPTSDEGFPSLFDMFLADYGEDKKKIEAVLKDDDDEECLRNFQLENLYAQPIEQPVPAPTTQRPKEGVLSDITNTKKGAKRQSRSDKGIKNTLAKYNQPSHTLKKRVPSELKLKSEIKNPQLKSSREKNAKVCPVHGKSSTRRIGKSKSRSPPYPLMKYQIWTDSDVSSTTTSDEDIPSELKLESKITNPQLKSSRQRNVRVCPRHGKVLPRRIGKSKSRSPPYPLMKYQIWTDSDVSSTTTSDEDMPSRVCTAKPAVQDTATSQNQVVKVSTVQGVVLNASLDSNESICSVGSEREFAEYLKTKGATSTPLASPEKPNLALPATLTKEDAADDNATYEYTLDGELFHYVKLKVDDPCSKKLTSEQTPSDTIPSLKKESDSLRVSKGTQRTFGNTCQEENEPIVVNETQLLESSSESQTIGLQSKLQPAKQTADPLRDITEDVQNKPGPSKPKVEKPKRNTQRNAKPRKVTGKSRATAKMMQEDKLTEDMSYNKLQAQVVAPVRSKRQRDMDQFFDDVKRMRTNMESASVQPDSEFADIQYCPSKRQLSTLECVAVGQRHTGGEMTVTVNEPQPTVPTPVIDQIIHKYKGKAGTKKSRKSAKTSKQ